MPLSNEQLRHVAHLARLHIEQPRLDSLGGELDAILGMVDALRQGSEPEINDTKTYDNGVKVVPSDLLEPVSVDASNWEKVLIDSGYYTMDQIK